MAILKRPPEPDSLGGALDRIAAARSSLPRSERRAAEYLLNHPEQAIAMSISELAEACGIAQSTVSRLCKSLGVNSYAALRLGIANDYSSQTPHPQPHRPEGELGELTRAIGMIESHGVLREAAEALRYASHVDIWPDAEFTVAAGRLADRLTALGVPAASAPAQSAWAARAAGLPPESIIISLSARSVDQSILRTARQHGARLLCCTQRPSGTLEQLSDWLLPLAGNVHDDLLAFTATDAIATAVTEISAIPGPDGPASPWRRWPHVRTLLFPSVNEPVPALLLAHEDPPTPRPVVIYFGGMHQPKEGGLPGTLGTNDHFDGRMLTALLNSGYHIVIPDAVAHGARKRAWDDTWQLICDSFGDHGTDVFQRARDDAPALVDGVLGLNIADQSAPRVAVVGQSWGGLQALLTLAGDDRLVCGIAINPVVDLLLWPHAAHLNATRVRATQPGPWMSEFLAPRPLLVIAGENDQTAPAGPIQAFADAVRPAYQIRGAADRLACTTLPGIAHQFHPSQLEATLTWLTEHLQPESGISG